jgi:cell division cycle 2-like protein
LFFPQDLPVPGDPRFANATTDLSAMKRDRWESSSDEEEQVEPNPTEQSLVEKASPPEASLPKHNPLTSGCRSVYDCYERLARLEEGTYGVVWKARDLGTYVFAACAPTQPIHALTHIRCSFPKATDEIVALKQIKFDSEMTKEGFPVTALREISVLLSLSHECVVSVREMVVGNSFDKVFMVMEVSNNYECFNGRIVSHL